MIVSIILSCLATSTLAKVNYDGYQVHRVQVNDKTEASHLDNLQKDGLFDLWSEIRVGGTVDVMSPPHLVPVLKDWLDNTGLKHSIMIQDVETLIQLESKSGVSNSQSSMDWTSYHSLEEIYDWFDVLVKEYDFAEIEIIGQSFEGRDMKVMKLCRGGCGNKPAMWIDSGIHAREWISPATGTWMLNELLENDAEHPEFTEKLDWYFLPSANPDGYHKSRNENRLWRKTTTQYPENPCQGTTYGTDANRNFDFHWAEAGASGDSCSLTYHGPEAFSEIEARNIRDYILARKGQIKFFQTLHCYSQLILFPWGYTTSPAPGYDAMLDLANRGNEALFETHGKRYEAGCIPCVLYTASGTSLDWALGVAEVPYVYSIELRDTGEYGFILPAEQIIPTAEETWAWHAVAAEQMITEFGM